MKIAIVQQNYHIGNFEHNRNKIVKAIEKAKSDQADLVVFSELCVCGYPPRDFLEFDDFIANCYESIELIKAHSNGIGVIIGSPQRNLIPEGKDLFNSAVFLHDKQIIGVANKSLLPTYDVFDEYRYFEPSNEWKVIEFKGERIALTICEDIWNLTENPLYRVSPMELLIRENPTLLINVTASPFDYDHDDDRKEIILANIQKYHIPIIYCNTVGAQTELIFDGGSLVFDRSGKLCKELKYFEEDYYLAVTENITDAPAGEADKYKFVDERVARLKESNKVLTYLTTDKNISQIYNALILGIRDYFTKMGFSKATLGASGGIDSAVVQALAVAALGKENVHVLLMPSQYSSGHSIADAEQLSQNLGNAYEVLAIKDIFDQYLTTLLPVFEDLPFSIAEENLQSRIRGNLLMAFANKFSYILLNTSNKSELAVGYGTLYGDMAGGISILGDLYKTQIFALAKFINRGDNIIPENILTKAPSAELREGQKDTDALPEYDVLDRVLYEYIERRRGPKDIINLGFEIPVVDRILKLVNTAEFKRNQFCPILRVSRKAFGVGRRMPIVGKYLS
ncbi:NAD+ synthase [Mucilaginibacter sp. HC2]|jgi:NAD+ synthase (glutamine-hydrolysing)|uniref:NAD+ synthase n=1 Tax=Mucilaginibacter TaxID=423349 RepID=UPI000DCC7554|nr:MULTISPECIES: NAD+ synthase [Mucilaginibacter]NHA05604.1 NAD+ synthase [Mucilaginibacter inviolabilis]QTE35410.1 NAD+ synthase [Mucilaginibacter gossypii]RAV59388.1 NAD+ synthase [Mucilaginibacter rubeus]